MKPWDPPEQRLYPVLDDLLGEWARARAAAVRGHPRRRVALVAAELRREGVPVAQPGARTSGSTSSRTRRRASSCSSLAGDPPRLPVVLFPDGTHAGRADDRASWPTKVGLQTLATRPFYDLVIIGGGPAGLANAVYAASEGLHRCC